jgi:peptidyl-tRNA hydrolase, PTH1 family
MVIEAFARQSRIPFSEERKTFTLGKGRINHDAIFIAKPLTFMNRSGPVVKHLLAETEVDPSCLIVVHDDIDLELGRIQIKSRGGHGGHKGIHSILSTLQTDRFHRLRIGINRPPEKIDAADYVLRRFKAEEHSLLEEVIQKSVEALRSIVIDGIQKAMDQYNKK